MGSRVSVLASLPLVQAFIELMPPEVPEYFRSIFSRWFSAEVTFVIEESHEQSTNHLYKAAVTYLGGDVLFPSTGLSSAYSSRKFTVGKSQNTKKMVFGLAKNSEIVDDFQGVRMKWKFGYYHDIQSGKRTEKSWYELSFPKKHLEMVKNKYLPHVLDVAHKIHDQNRIVKFYTSRKDSWTGSGICLEHPMTFDTLAMDGKRKKELIEDLDSFINDKQYYQKIGKVWKRGYLLYGPPGTGKSSLVAAMANHLNYDVYNLNLSAVKSDSVLECLLLHVTNRSILVVEDIDCFVHLQNREETPKEKRTQTEREESPDRSPRLKVTLSGLLNAIDGLLSCCGEERIIVFTTNYKERIDPALLRAGRMDKHICMSYCSFSIFKQLAANYLNINDHHLFPRIEKLIAEVEICPAEVAGELMRIKNTRSTLQELVEHMNSKIGKQVPTNEVKEEGEEESLSALLSKHGDIATNCSLQSSSRRSSFLEIACRIVQKLEETELKKLEETDLKTIIADIDNFESENMEVGWLRRLNEITETMKVDNLEGGKRRKINGAAITEKEMAGFNSETHSNVHEASPTPSEEEKYNVV